MKKKNLIFSALLFFSILPMALFAGCDKDTNCYLEVKVLSESSVDPISGALIPGSPVANAEVQVYQKQGGTVQDRGITGSDGVYSTYFKAPAIVNIKANITLPNGVFKGETAVRLIQGETISATVNLTR